MVWRWWLRVGAGAIFPHLPGVEADHRAVFVKFDGQWQADVAKTDDGQRGVRGGEVAENQGGDPGEVQGVF